MRRLLIHILEEIFLSSRPKYAAIDVDGLCMRMGFQRKGLSIEDG